MMTLGLGRVQMENHANENYWTRSHHLCAEDDARGENLPFFNLH